MIDRLKKYNSTLCWNQIYKSKNDYILEFFMRYHELKLIGQYKNTKICKYTHIWNTIYKNLDNKGYWINYTNLSKLHLKFLKKIKVEQLNGNYIIKDNCIYISSNCFINNFCHDELQIIFNALDILEEYYDMYNIDLFGNKQ